MFLLFLFPLSNAVRVVEMNLDISKKKRAMINEGEDELESICYSAYVDLSWFPAQN